MRLPIAVAVLLAGLTRAAAADVSFELDVIPILSKAGCNGGGCHGALGARSCGEALSDTLDGLPSTRSRVRIRVLVQGIPVVNLIRVHKLPGPFKRVLAQPTLPQQMFCVVVDVAPEFESVPFKRLPAGLCAVCARPRLLLRLGALLPDAVGCVRPVLLRESLQNARGDDAIPLAIARVATAAPASAEA